MVGPRLLWLPCLLIACADGPAGDAWNGVPTVGATAVPEVCAAIDSDQGFVEGDSAGVVLVANATPVWNDAQRPRFGVTPSLTIGTAPGDEAQEFGDIGAVKRLPDGRIVIADVQARELRVFDAGGAFLRAVGGPGEGPGEFQQVRGMHRLGGDTLMVPSFTRFTTLTADGDLVATATYESVPLEFRPEEPGGSPIVRRIRPVILGAFADRTLLVAVRRNARRPDEVTVVFRDTLTLYRMGLNAELADSVATALGETGYEYWPGDGSVWFNDEPFGTARSIAVGPDRFYAGAGDRFLIDEYTATGMLARRIMLCEQPDPITDALYDDYVERAIEPVDPEFKAGEERAYRSIPRRPAAAAHLNMILDQADRIWVRDFTFAGQPHVWKLIDRAGRWLGDIEAPADLDVLDAGPDWALGRARDEFDVQSVRLYALAPAR